MNITIVAGLEAVNGVLRTMEALEENCTELGHRVTTIMPKDFRFKARLSDVTMAITTRGEMHRRIVASKPDAVSIMTEDSLGFLAAWDAHAHGYPFTTMYCTHIHKYSAERVHPMTEPWVKSYLSWIHSKAARIHVARDELGQEMQSMLGIKTSYHVIGRGINSEDFHPGLKMHFNDLARPISLYAGRIAEEKNLDAFLDMKIPGTRVLVGEGPAMARLQGKYAADPNVVFVGPKEHAEVADHMRSTDIFVFPSRTDTFGRVGLEAKATGAMLVSYDEDAGVFPDLIHNDKRIGACGPVLQDAWYAAYDQWLQTLDVEEAERQYRFEDSRKHTNMAVAEKFVAGLEPIPADYFRNDPAYKAA